MRASVTLAGKVRQAIASSEAGQVARAEGKFRTAQIKFEDAEGVARSVAEDLLRLAAQYKQDAAEMRAKAEAGPIPR